MIANPPLMTDPPLVRGLNAIHLAPRPISITLRRELCCFRMFIIQPRFCGEVFAGNHFAKE
jgi:hypothetical protein